jgi:hypothetical protein
MITDKINLVTPEQHIQRLKTMRADCQRFLESAKSKRRRMRPSERAMTIASYAMEIEALDYAIRELQQRL